MDLKNIKTEYLIAGGVIVILTLVFLNMALALVSAPSTIAVTVGSLILIAIVAIYIPIGIKLFGKLSEWMKILLIIACLFGVDGCKRIDPGYVGIKVDLYGGSKGVEPQPLPVGMVWYAPWATSIYEFPTFVRTAVWTRSADEGDKANEEISFNTLEGMVITGDISLSYHLDPGKVPTFFAKFRTDNLDTFTHGFLRNVARDAFSEIGVHYTVEQAYGAKKEELITAARARINEQTKDYGIIIEQFGFIGAPRLPASTFFGLCLGFHRR